MSVSLRWSGALAVAVLGMLGAQVGAQPGIRNTNANLLRPQIIPFAVNPNQYIAPNMTARQMSYNIGVLGRGLSQIPPYLLGYNPYPNPIINSGPVINPINPLLAAASSPYALSTMGGYNPYTSAGSLSASASSPYGLSTSPGGYGGFGPGMGGFPWWGGYGMDPGMSYGYALQGIASVTKAQGQYWQDIQQASLTREQVRQSAIETARRRLQFEMWYETIRPTAPKMRDAEMAADLDRARKDAPDAEVVSGRTLNVLLKSAQAASKTARGPNVTLDEEILQKINLNGGSAGNIGLLKNGAKFSLPEALQEAAFSETATRVKGNLDKAVNALKDGESVPQALLKDIRGDYKTINDKLNQSADELSPAQYIETRRFLNQVSDAIKALSDPNVKNYFNNTWKAKGKNVAELVQHMSREGLTFAAAAPGEEAAYRSLYQSLRAFESGLQSQK